MKKRLLALVLALSLVLSLGTFAVMAEDEEADQVTVTFIDEESEQEVSYTYTSGDEITLPDNLFDTPEGYSFAGWIDSGAFLYEAGATYTVTADTYFFTWYHVSEDEEDEEEEDTSETVVSGSCGDSAVWSYDSETGTLTISGTGEIYDYDYGETPWFEYSRKITSIVIEDGITGIGDYAFAYLYALESVTFSDTVITIGTAAFLGSGFSEIIIGKNVVSIGEGAFQECTYLTTIYIPDSVESIGDNVLWCYSVNFGVTIYYQGTEDEWDAIGLVENTWMEDNVTVVYECENVWGSDSSDDDEDEDTDDDSSTGTDDESESYDIIEAETSASYTLGSGTVAVIAIDADIDDFVSVAVDGTVITQNEDYTVSEGSTIITFTEEYLESLEAGTYDVVVTFISGTATGTLTILSAEDSSASETTAASSDTGEDVQTGDNESLIVWFVLLTAALAVFTAAGAAAVRKKS